VSFLTRITDKEVNFLPPRVRNPTVFETIMIYSGLPLSLAKVACLFTFNKPDRNPLANGNACSGNKVGVFAKDYSV